MKEETELKYKVGDVVLIKAKVVMIDKNDVEIPYKVETECENLWLRPGEIVGLAPKEEA